MGIKDFIRRVGHRGAVLLFLSLLDFLYGYSLIVMPVPQRNSINLMLPFPLWGWIWLGVGAFLLTGITARFDRVHYGVAVTLMAFWAAAWVNAWLFSGYPRAWISVVIWAAFGALVFVISTWPDVRTVKTKVKVKRVERERKT